MPATGTPLYGGGLLARSPSYANAIRRMLNDRPSTASIPRSASDSAFSPSISSTSSSDDATRFFDYESSSSSSSSFFASLFFLDDFGSGFSSSSSSSSSF